MTRRRTLVTGGTRGIGAAIAHRLAREGHDLVLGYARDDASAELAEADVEGAGAECTLVRCDLLDPHGVDELFAAAGPLTGVVNNAGATFHIGPLAETPVEMIRRTIDLNLTSAILVARAAVRALSTAYGGPGGVLVNISSGAATKGSPGEYVHYAAAKGRRRRAHPRPGRGGGRPGHPRGGGRARVDPDGHPRRGGRARPRGADGTAHPHAAGGRAGGGRRRRGMADER